VNSVTEQIEVIGVEIEGEMAGYPVGIPVRPGGGLYDEWAHGLSGNEMNNRSEHEQGDGCQSRIIPTVAGRQLREKKGPAAGQRIHLRPEQPDAPACFRSALPAKQPPAE